jgi:hypothetical protein
MAIPLYTSSPINTNSGMPASPSTFAMRYTPAAALEHQLAASASQTPTATPPLSNSSRTTTPSPAPDAQEANKQSHATNAATALTSTPPPTKAQPAQAQARAQAETTTPTHQQQSTHPALSRLSIPSTPTYTPPHSHYQPPNGALISPLSTPYSAYTYHPTHSRDISLVSQLSNTNSNNTYSPTPYTYTAFPFLSPQSSSHQHTTYRDLSHPPGYTQNTRDSFEDRIISRDPEEQSFLLSPTRQHRRGKSTASGPGILNGETDAGGWGGSADVMSATNGGDESLGRLWETASGWAKAAARKLGEGEETLWKAVSGEGR